MIGWALETLRLMAVSVKLTGTPSMNARDQEILREPCPFSVAVRSVGAGGGPYPMNVSINNIIFIRTQSYHNYHGNLVSKSWISRENSSTSHCHLNCIVVVKTSWDILAELFPTWIPCLVNSGTPWTGSVLNTVLAPGRSTLHVCINPSSTEQLSDTGVPIGDTILPMGGWSKKL